MSHTDPKGDSIAVSFSLTFLSQLLVTTTVVTVLTTFSIIPRYVRNSRCQSIFLLLIVLSVGGIAAWICHNLWLIPPVILFPLIVALIEGYSWAPWARINDVCVAQNVLALLLYSACVTFHSPGLLGWCIGVGIWVTQMLFALVSLAVTFDLWNVLGRRRFIERDRLLVVPDPVSWPSVCIQVAAYNEPTEMLAKTIKQLMQQDYPGRWMVQVIDNNTPDPHTWLPIQQLCQELGDQVQFIHLENWPGYKSGALNEGTRRLPSWVEVVAVVDADYLVEPDFLRATARHFADPQITFVQSPQHYREWQGIPYFEGLNYMYEYFFATYLIGRQEMNGVVCSGTMCLLRRRALEEVGGWDEESITEDAELSVRLLGRGGRGLYDHRCYGAGLMPFNFGSLKKQRFRWAFGNIHLLKKHWRLMLFGRDAKKGYQLNFKQRLCFCGIGSLYFAEVPAFISALLLMVTVFAAFLGWQIDFSLLNVALIGSLLLAGTAYTKTIWASKEATGCTYTQAIRAFIFSLALSWTTCIACLAAIVHRKGVFLRTPKVRSQQKWQQALQITSQEIVLSLGFLTIAMFATVHSAMSPLVGTLLALQAGVYGSAVVCALAAEGIWLGRAALRIVGELPEVKRLV